MRSSGRYNLLLLLSVAVTTTTTWQLALSAEVTPPSAPLPEIPQDPLAAGCVRVENDMGWICPSSASEAQHPELQLLARAGLRMIGMPVLMVLKDYPGYPYDLSQLTLNLTLIEEQLAMLPEGARFVDMQNFRLRGGAVEQDTVERSVFPVFYNRRDLRWEPFDKATCSTPPLPPTPSAARIVRCVLTQAHFLQHTGLRMLAVNVVSDRRAAVLDLLANATAATLAAGAQICVFPFEQFARYCPGSAVYAEAVRYGSNSMRSSMMSCNHPMCMFYPANGMHFYQGACVLGFNKQCGIKDPVTGKDNCCPMRDLNLDNGKMIWDILGTFSAANNDNAAVRRASLGYNDYFGYTIQPGTFADPASAVAILDSVAAPSDMPLLHPTLTMGVPAINVALRSVPTKPIEVWILNSETPDWDTKCGKASIYQNTAMSIFYYDAPTRRWVSFPHQGDETTTGYFTYNATSRRGTAVIPPRIAIRNDLSIFLTLAIGIPKLPGDAHLRETFLVPPAGIRKQDLYKEGLALPTFNVECTIMYPVPLGFLDRVAAAQGMSVVGSPGTSLPLSTGVSGGYSVSLFTDPALLRQVASEYLNDLTAQYGSGANGERRRRRLLQLQSSPVSVYYTNGTTGASWKPVPDGMCSFNAVTSTSECSIPDSFFQANGYNLTFANMASETSNVSLILRRDAERAAWLETRDTTTLQALFDAQALGGLPLTPAPTPAPTASPAANGGVPTEGIIALIVFVCLILAVIIFINFFRAKTNLATTQQKFSSLTEYEPVPTKSDVRLHCDVESFLSVHRAHQA